MCILQSKEGRNVESTIAEADKNAEKPTRYNRIQRKTLMISVTTSGRRKRDEMTIVGFRCGKGDNEK